MMQGLLDQPVPIVFCMAQGYQQIADGSLNILGIGDRVNLMLLPGQVVPDAVNLQFITQWTGGVGQFEQVMRVMDQDMQLVAEARTPFALAEMTTRHTVIGLLVVPFRAGIYTVILGRGDLELLRQNITLALGELAPGA